MPGHRPWPSIHTLSIGYNNNTVWLKDKVSMKISRCWIHKDWVLKSSHNTIEWYWYCYPFEADRKFTCEFSLIQCEVASEKVFTIVRSLARHRVIDISMGPYHSSVIVEPGHVYTFGRNVEGQLGTGNTKPQNAPIEIKFFQQQLAFVSRIWHSIILTKLISKEYFRKSWFFFYQRRIPTPPAESLYHHRILILDG